MKASTKVEGEEFMVKAENQWRKIVVIFFAPIVITTIWLLLRRGASAPFIVR